MADLPEPLVPPEVDLVGFSSFMLDVDRLLASELVAIGTPEECWAAVLLWCRAWKQVPAASLPDDQRILAAFSGAGKRWAKVKGMALRGFIKCSDGRLYHKVLAAEANEAWERRKKFKDRSAKANERRWAGHNSSDEPTGGKGGQEGSEKLPLNHPSNEPQGVQDGILEGVQQAHQQALLAASKPDPTRPRRDRTGQDTEETTTAADPQTPDLESRCRRAVGEEPCCVATDFGTILRLVDEPGIIEPDVLAGIAAGLAKAEPGFRFTRWSKFDGWIRGAARDRLAGKPRNGAAQSAEATIDIRGIPVPESRVKAKVDHWLDTGEWPEELFQRWGPPPGKMGSYIPPRFLAREPVH